jgi:hypothetical protein
MYIRRVIWVVVGMHIISGSLAISSIMWQTKELKKFIQKETH